MIILPNTITKPSRYTGAEPNRVIKEMRDVSVRFALCYPDVYEVGMSYYGYFLLYGLANSVDGVWCERCFAPWLDMETHLKERGAALFTLESRTPLHGMDLVGFSLSYELNITNVLNMLKLGGIKVRAAERERGPIVIGGGPLMLNPRPFEGFFDLIVVGEAHHVLVELLRRYREMKGERRQKIIEELAGLDGVYSPLFGKKTVQRQYITDLDNAFHPVTPPIPVTGSIHNRLNIEISRGCGNGCRFCLAGYGYRPYRERSFDRITEIIRSGLIGTGYEEISLLSLSSGDYSSLFETISYVKERHKGIFVSLPSLKIGSVSEGEIGAIGDIARTGLTFALEAASPYTRHRINKNIDVDALISQIPVLRKFGWRRLKLYFMVGFPWEGQDEAQIIREIVVPFEKAGIEVNLAVSPFIPKPHTPFQRLPMEDRESLNEKLWGIKRILRKKGARVKYRDVETSIAEAVISRGDGKLQGLFESLADKSIRLEAWREFFNPAAYHEWFDKNDVDIEAYIGGRDPDEALPWDFIDTGIDGEFLNEELRKAEGGETTVDCYSGCAGCGLGCRVEGLRSLVQTIAGPERGVAKGEGDSANLDIADKIQDSIPGAGSTGLRNATRVTFRYSKFADARYIGHIDMMSIILRAIRSTGLTIKTHGKYRPMPNIAMVDALPLGVESACELIEVEFAGDVAVSGISLDGINKRLPPGLRMIEVIESNLKDMLKEYAFILISHENPDIGELKEWRNFKGRWYYVWRGKGIKTFLQKGLFHRIIKIDERRLHGFGTDY